MNEPAVIHDRDPAGDCHRLLLVVSDNDKGETEAFLQLHQLELRLAAQLFVERGKRFIEQQNARTFDQRTSKRDALALAAGEVLRLALGESLEPDQR